MSDKDLNLNIEMTNAGAMTKMMVSLFIKRINPERVLWVSKPEYDLGQEVETANETHRIGNIATRVWHSKKKRFTY